MITYYLETHCGGHRLEFAAHFVAFFQSIDREGEPVCLLLHPDLAKHLPAACGTLEVRAIPADVMRRLEATGSLWRRSELEMQYLESVLAPGDHVILSDLDRYQLALGLRRFRRVRYTVSGVLLKPYCQLPRTTWTYRRQRLRKYLQLRWILGNRAVKAAFILNDAEAARHLNATRSLRAVFSPLPDPVATHRYRLIDIRQRYGIAPHRAVLLVIGGIQRKKNIGRVIVAMTKLPPPVQQRTTLLILGRCQNEALLAELRAEIAAVDPGVCIQLHDQFVDADLFESALATAAMVLAVYINSYCSSGIIGQAAKHDTPTVATKNGVIGRTVRAYRLGCTVDELSETDISRGIQQLLAGAPSDSRAARYVAEHSPHHFVGQLLASAYGSAPSAYAVT